MNLRFEVLVIPVSDVDRAKAVYEKLGFRLDIDYTADERFRVLQFTRRAQAPRSSSARGSFQQSPAP